MSAYLVANYQITNPDGYSAYPPGPGTTLPTTRKSSAIEPKIAKGHCFLLTALMLAELSAIQ